MATITITEEQLQGAISAAVKAALTQVGAAGAPPPQKHLTEEERFHNALGHDAPVRTGRPEKIVHCVTDSGSSFDAVVVPDRRNTTGRVIRLDNYAYPEPLVFPENMPHIDPKSGQLNLQAKQWRWTTYWQADIKQYVGGEASRLPKVDVKADVKAEAKTA